MEEDSMLEEDLEKDFVFIKDAEDVEPNPLCPKIKVTKKEMRNACYWSIC